MHYVQLDASSVVRDVVDAPPLTAYPSLGYVIAPANVGLLWKLVGSTWTDTPEAAALRAQRAADLAAEATKESSRSRDQRVAAAVIAGLADQGIAWQTAVMRLLVDNINRVPVANRTARETQFMQLVQQAAAANP